jgi:hypothetical protein
MHSAKMKILLNSFAVRALHSKLFEIFGQPQGKLHCKFFEIFGQPQGKTSLFLTTKCKTAIFFFKK